MTGDSFAIRDTHGVQHEKRRCFPTTEWIDD